LVSAASLEIAVAFRLRWSDHADRKETAAQFVLKTTRLLARGESPVQVFRVNSVDLDGLDRHR
jgi:hypothetical protein